MLETISADTDDDDASSTPSFQEGVVSVLGHRMAYVVGGAGEPVILLHGLGHASGTWTEVLPRLARHFRVYAIDMLGCGRSDTPRIEYHLWALATYTRYFMDAVGIERAHLVGHSLGGGIAMHVAGQYPERVKRLALVATGGLGREVNPLLRLVSLPGASLVLAGIASPAWLLILKRFRFARMAAPLAREKLGMWTRLGQVRHRRVFMRMLRSVCNIRGQQVSALDRLHHLQHPVLLIWGDHDTTVPLAHARRAAALIRGCQLEILPGCNHYPPLEQPEAVAPLLEEFLLAPEGLPAAAPSETMAALERADHRHALREEGGEMAAGIA
jgi:pimeloyl-ACP methyl ester carboxylesterase